MYPCLCFRIILNRTGFIVQTTENTLVSGRRRIHHGRETIHLIYLATLLLTKGEDEVVKSKCHNGSQWKLVFFLLSTFSPNLSLSSAYSFFLCTQETSSFSLQWAYPVFIVTHLIPYSAALGVMENANYVERIQMHNESKVKAPN